MTNTRNRIRFTKNIKARQARRTFVTDLNYVPEWAKFDNELMKRTLLGMPKLIFDPLPPRAPMYGSNDGKHPRNTRS